MPIVETSVWIKAPLDRVVAVAQDNESFPQFMKDVLSIQIVERDAGRVVSDWVGVVSAFGVKVRWRQEDVWDDGTHECRFRQLQGDYEKLEGTWTFREEDGGTRFDSTVDYVYDVPTIGALVKKVVHGLVVKNLQDTLDAIKSRCEASG
ncbi:MAG: SRPBCC family protein [Armatimonadetes bacterium]|nr:SRPBCC family protein [Armatimonadota bacterium]